MLLLLSTIKQNISEEARIYEDSQLTFELLLILQLSPPGLIKLVSVSHPLRRIARAYTRAFKVEKAVGEEDGAFYFDRVKKGEGTFIQIVG